MSRSEGRSQIDRVRFVARATGIAVATALMCACGSSVDPAQNSGVQHVADAGSTHVPRDAATPDSTDSPQTTCLPPLATCDAPGATCCGSAKCVERDGARRCVQTCSTRFDCGSLCCLPEAATGGSLCAAADLCPPIECSGVAGVCDGPGRSCCAGLTCVSSPSSDYSGCRKHCKVAADCDTGCCVPFSDGTSGFCAASAACTCSGENAACGGARHCCSNLACAATSSAGDFACKPTCKTNADCPTHCCVPIQGTQDSVCLSAATCGG